MAMDTQLLTAAKPGFTTISPNRSTVLAFDREGRLPLLLQGGPTYRRTLDSAVEVRWRERQRQRRRLSPGEAAGLFAEAYAVAAGATPGPMLK